MKEHDVVELLRDIIIDGLVVPSGSVGTIISVHQGGAAFTVEFSRNNPAAPTIVNVVASDLVPA